jgi:hypothetical protein
MGSSRWRGDGPRPIDPRGFAPTQPHHRRRRLGKIALYMFGLSLVGTIGLVTAVAVFRDELVTLDD